MSRIVNAFVVASAALACACVGVIDSNETMGSGSGGGGGNSGSSGSSGNAGTGGSDRPPNMDTTCTGWEIAMPKRVIRLSFGQIAASMRPIFGDAFADNLITSHAITDPAERTFPPLGDTKEGTSYIATKWQTADAIATAAGQYTFDNFASFTQCAEPATVECGQAFVLSLAERAFRRPLGDRERSSLLQVYTESQGFGASVPESVQYAVAAIFSSPSFLYRTELGTELAREEPLLPHEVASQISYFLTDGPPDQGLLDAAAQNALSTPEQIAPHVDRLLALPSTRQNLQSIVFAALGISRVLSVVIDSTKVPEEDFNSGVAASMYREGELFINNTIWSGKVSELVTSRRTFIDGNLAPLYGVPAPTTGLDADGFGLVEVPTNRSGVLTMLGFLTSRSRPDTQSVVGRGLAVNDAVLCQQNPAFPEDPTLVAQIDMVNQGQEAMNLSEREKADYRAATSPCNACHLSFDPYGVALENFDIIGRFRTTDDEDRPIDAAVTLPATVGGTQAMNAVEVGAALANTGAFSACVATKLMTYALAETGVKGNSCATKAVATAFGQTDQSFAALVRAVALSKTLTHRTGG